MLIIQIRVVFRLSGHEQYLDSNILVLMMAIPAKVILDEHPIRTALLLFIGHLLKPMDEQSGSKVEYNLYPDDTI